MVGRWQVSPHRRDPVTTGSPRESPGSRNDLTWRTTVNSWEDIEFVQAVHATGRRKLVICARWTEICMAFTALDALREGYEVYPVVDAIGGTSPEAHRAGLDRVMQAGGQPVSWVSLACELQRDWARDDTVEAVIEIVLTDRLRKE
jgi:isochorismate hydrolase